MEQIVYPVLFTALVAAIGYLWKREFDREHEAHKDHAHEQKEFREKVLEKLSTIEVNLARNCEVTQWLKDKHKEK